MSGPSNANDTPITDHRQLVEVLASGEKPIEAWRIGTEHEKFGFRLDDLRPPTFDGERGIEALLKGLTRFGWTPYEESVDGQPARVIALTRDMASVTLEPAGQLELSGAPVETIHDTCKEVGSHLREVRAVADELQLGFLGMGFQPKWRRDEMPWMPKGRYKIMRAYMPKVGSLGLDMALGVGGVPRGRIIEVYGPESSGKTTLALHILAEAQKKGGDVAFIDVEHALDPVYAEALGVDINNLLVSQPDTGEQAMEICEALVRSGAIDAIVVDSVAAMVPRAEIEGEMGDSHVGLQARLMSQAMRKLTSVIGKTNTVCVFINQLREKVGVVYGNPEVTTGGRALKYYSSVRIDIRRVEGLKDSSGQFIGNHTRAKIVKNKVAPPFREAEFDIMFGEGISKVGELLDLGVKLGIVQKSGAWFNYGDMRLGQGRDNSKQFLKDNPEIANDIEGQIRANADKLYASRRSSGRAAAADKAEEAAAPAEGTKEPVVKAPARSSESELDIMVED